MYHANNEKRKTTCNGRNRTTILKQNQNARRILGNVEEDAIKHAKMKEKKI